MKKHLLLIIVLCVANAGFAQVKVNSAGNTGMGNDPNSKARLLLYNSTTSTDTVFGLRTTMKNASSSSTTPVYGIHSIANSSSAPLYGAYFKNTQSKPGYGESAPLYGIYLDNNNSTFSSTIYGFYVNNLCTGYAATLYGNYYKNTLQTTVGGTLYGTYSENIFRTTDGSAYGAYFKTTKGSSGGSGTLYGVQVVNVDSSAYSSVYGIHVSSTKTVGAPVNVYGVYAAVSGGYGANYRYAGYFTGGKVVIAGVTGVALDVSGEVWAEGAKLTSDERLKTDIKPLSDEKDKLYLLQGKSYKKKPRPIASEEDSLAKKIEIIGISEYGYLAQELKEIFPDLVGQDSVGYYGVNYIGLIPVIVEALKDQRIQIADKQIQIENQQAQIDEQREQIKQLVKLIDIKSINKEVFEENGIESIPLLLQNTPNPFNQVTEIGYYIPENVNSANIYIYDINGFQQRNISISERGKGATTLQASALQAGIYFYTLICDGKPVDTKQMILTR